MTVRVWDVWVGVVRAWRRRRRYKRAGALPPARWLYGKGARVHACGCARASVVCSRVYGGSMCFDADGCVY